MRSSFLAGTYVPAGRRSGWRVDSGSPSGWPVTATTSGRTPLRGTSRSVRLVGGLLRRVDRFLYVGEATRRLFRSYGAPESALVRAPHAVDNGRFAEQSDADRPRTEGDPSFLGNPRHAFCVLFVGKLESKKRPTEVIAALGLLKRMDPGRTYHALFVGAGNQATALKGKCRVAFDAKGGMSAGAAASELVPASFTGFLNQSEITRAYVAADVLVLPSDVRKRGASW